MSKTRFQRSAKSSRELRRMAEREQGRERRMQAIDAFWKLPPEVRAQRMADNEAFQRISKNGITIDDVHQAEENAYSKGVEVGKNAAVETCFAAICLSLHELHGFGCDECSQVLNDTYERLCYALNSQEAIQEVYDKIGLEIRFNGDLMEEAVAVKEA